MLRIAICDDEAAARDALRIQLEKVLIEETEEIIYEFSSGIHAASWLAKHPGEADILFLDMEMKGYSGMETAEKIRTFDNDLLIVFVTGYSDYVFDGYRVGAMDYIINPDAVEYLGGDSVTVDGAEPPCSRRYRESAASKIAGR